MDLRTYANTTISQKEATEIEMPQAIVRAQLPNEQSDIHRQLFIDECCKCMTRTLMTVGSATQATAHTIAQLSKDLSEAIRCARQDEQLLLEQDKLPEKSLGAEYEGLLQVPKIRDVQVEGSTIIVCTNLLYARDDRTNRTHEIGAFRITLDPSNEAPIWRNETRLVRGYSADMHAPHIFSNGKACLGNTSELFKELLGARQFAVAAQLAIEFVENANTSDSAGKHVDCWPVA